MSIHVHFWVILDILTSKVGQTDLVLVCNQSPLVGLSMQDHKFRRVSVTICDTLD